MADTEWWQRGGIDGVPAVLQPVADLLLQVRESVGELVASLAPTAWPPGGSPGNTEGGQTTIGTIRA
jgi:hypothetical protein